MITFNKELFKLKGVTLLYYTDNIAENLAYIYALKRATKDFPLGLNKYTREYIFELFNLYTGTSKADILSHGSFSILIDKTHPEFAERPELLFTILSLFTKTYIVSPSEINHNIYRIDPSINIIESMDKNYMIIRVDYASIIMMATHRKQILSKREFAIFNNYITQPILNGVKCEIITRSILLALDNPQLQLSDKYGEKLSEPELDFYNKFNNKETQYHGKTSLDLYASPLLLCPLKFMDNMNFLYTHLKYNHGYDKSSVLFDKRAINSIIPLTYGISAPLIVLINILKLFDGVMNSTLIENSVDDKDIYDFSPNRRRTIYIDNKLYTLQEYLEMCKNVYETLEIRGDDSSNMMVLPQATNFMLFITAPISSYINFIKKCNNSDIDHRFELKDIAKQINDALIIYNIVI